jgi:hypothetical protein
MNTARIENVTGRPDYQSPRLTAYGALTAITGTQIATSHCLPDFVGECPPL